MGWRGVHTAMVTPFDEEGALDLAAWEGLCARQVDAGIDGLVVCGTTGESPTVTATEAATLLREALAVSAGRVPVTVGIGTNATSLTVARAEQAAAAGASAGLLVLPYYNRPNPHGLKAHIEQVAAAGLPLVLYHVPARTAQRLSPGLLAELAATEGVVAIKEATGDLRFGGDLLRRTATPVLSGDDFTYLPLLSIGAQGVISVVSNVDPARVLALQAAWDAGDTIEAARNFGGLWDLVGFLFSDTNPVPCKAALAELGLCRPDVRLPLGNWHGPSPRRLLTALGLLA